MAGVVFFFEENDVDVFSGRRDLLGAWNYACKVAGDIDKAIVVNRTSLGVTPFDRAMDIQIVDEIPKLSEKYVTLVTPWNASPAAKRLWSFDHDVEWYVFGDASGRVMDGPELTIPQAGTGALHSVHVASVVLAHRFAVVSGAV